MSPRRDYAAIAEEAVVSNRPLLALEFRPAALAALDAFIDLTWGEDGAAPGDDRWQPGRKGVAILGFGAFLGELLRRQFGGEWREDPAQPDNVLAARVVLSGGHQVFPISKVYRRLRDGAGDRLEPLYRLVRDRVGAAPSAAEADGWVRQARHFEGVGRPDLVARFCERALALGPAPPTRVEIEALRATASSATRAAEVEARARAAAAANARLADRAAEGRQRLASFGVCVEHGALTLLGLDTFLDETFGRGPVAGPKRQGPLEGALAAFLGELMCSRYRGRWCEPPAEGIDPSDVVWPSGLTGRPLEILSRRLEQGAPGILEQVGSLVTALVARGEAEDPPEDPKDWFDQAEAYAENARRLDLAARLGKVALGFAGGDTAARRLRLAEWCRALGRLDDARSHLDAGLRLDPRSVALRRDRDLLEAAGLAKERRHAEALAAFERALELDPTSAPGLLGKARTLLALGRIEECRDWLDGFAGRSDSEPERTELAAQAADRAGDVVATHELFDRLKDHARLPAESRARAEARARALADEPSVRIAAIERLPDVDAAVSAYARLNADHPSLAEPWRERGVGLAMLGRDEEALECLRRAAALEPADPKSYDHEEGVVLARLNRLDEAIAALDRGLRSCPTSGTLLARRGVFLAMSGRNEEALRACDAALAADPAYAETWAFKGDIEQRLGRTPQAIASLHRYVAARPGSREKRVEVARRQLWTLRNPGKQLDRERAQACVARAFERVHASALSEALARFDEAVEADPLFDEAWLNRGTCLYQMSRFEEALSSFARAEELGVLPNLVTDNRVACLFQLGRGEEALACYERLLARSPSSPEGLRGSARTLVRLARPAEALPLYRRLLARSPGDTELAREHAEAVRAASR